MTTTQRSPRMNLLCVREHHRGGKTTFCPEPHCHCYCNCYRSYHTPPITTTTAAAATGRAVYSTVKHSHHHHHHFTSAALWEGGQGQR